MDLQITQKQRRFIDADADEVLFGGAAGGGKSYGQCVDALLYALKYPKSKQLILRRTYLDLERSLIMQHLAFYPRQVYRYNSSNHRGTFANGSMIEFGYCDSERDVYRYQGAEYDVIRFDELTHFTDHMYIYLISRLRGANDYPKQVKSSTNPGGVGHSWVKSRFIDVGPPDTLHQADGGTRLFIPSLVQDNPFLMEHDPGYIKRLENLAEADRKALLYGDWDIFEGQYFNEWRREIHVLRPFEIPEHWRRYVTLDYGLDMLAAYWVAMDTQGRAYVYKELYQSGLRMSEAARAVREMTGETVRAYFAPPDLWNRRQDTGRSVAQAFAAEGIPLSKAQNNRVMGWYDLKEWLHPYEDETGLPAANLRVFESCVNLIRCIPALQFDSKNPNDAAGEPHEITHGPDAIRYFCAGRPRPNRPEPKPEHYNFTIEKPQKDPAGRGEKVRVL